MKRSTAHWKVLYSDLTKNSTNPLSPLRKSGIIWDWPWWGQNLDPCSIHRAVERLGWKGALKISLSIVLEAVVPLQCRREDCPGRGGSVSQWVTAHPASKAPQGGTSSETSWAPPVKAFSRQTDTLTTMLQHLQPSHWLTGDLLPEYFGGCG